VSDLVGIAAIGDDLVCPEMQIVNRQRNAISEMTTRLDRSSHQPLILDGISRKAVHAARGKRSQQHNRSF
jgi:hypothetical protein